MGGHRERVLGKEKERPRYLWNENLEKRKGVGIRALVKLRCGNLEEDNKYWLDKDKRICRFCKKGYDNMEHYVGKCEIASIWFENLGKD